MTIKNPAVQRTLKLAVTVLLPLTLLAACSTSNPNPGPPPVIPTSYQDNGGIGGEIVTDAISKTATVVSVDPVKSLVVLKHADGTTVTYRALPNAFAFDDIKAGDVVKVSVTEEIAVFLGRNSVPASAANSARLRINPPDKTQAVAAEVGTISFTAKITAIDDWADTVTLQLADGSTKTIKVSEFVNLADVSVGDNVSA